MTERLPAALTIAGSDSSGGAGIQADLKTFAANGAYGASVIVALTAQNTTGVQGVHLVPADFVSAQLNSVFSDLNIVALKTGMLATAEIIEVVAGRLAMEADAQVVVDPVMVATSGDRLLADDAVAAMRSTLVPCADLITPNLHEAAVLLDTAPARTREEAAAQGRELLKFGCRGVLMKGGHGSGLDAADCLVLPDRDVWFTAPRVETTNTHGTGCTLSAAIVAGLTRDLDLPSAIERGKGYLTRALEAGAGQTVGAGSGPPDHLVDIRRA
jgi:hydroxymethylpyrimidine/phosphomethylpyrimidine kinase